MSIFYRDGTISTLISVLYRDETISTFIYSMTSEQHTYTPGNIFLLE